MSRLVAAARRPSLSWLLIFVPVSIVADLSGHQTTTFLTSAVAVVPLAGLIGEATGEIAIRLGPRAGGLLNATFGNLTELIVAVFLIESGDVAIVKASLIGSIVGNLLLVLGLSFMAGGLRQREMTFNAQAASVHSSSMLLAVAALVVPAILVTTTPTVGQPDKEVVSVVVAGVLIVVYLAALAFTQITHAHLFGTPEHDGTPHWPMWLAVVVLAGAAALVAVESEMLVGSLHPAIGALHVPAVFVGLILVPIIGNAAEHASAVLFAVRRRVDVTLEIAVGSSTQVAMLIAPLLVFISLALAKPMDFVFTPFEVAIVGVATVIVVVISLDGRSNWLEGLQLVGAYAVIGISAYFVTA
jgi:Ca2+:H+ antiporter